MDVGIGKRLGRYFISSPGRLYGVVFRLHGRLSVVALCRRGIVYRIGARIFQPHWFYWESLCGVRKEIWGIRVYQNWMAKDEVVGIKCGYPGLHCALHRSRSGIDMFLFTWMSPEWIADFRSKNQEIFATDNELYTGVYSREERY